MAALAIIIGLVLILTVLWDAFETIVLPRRVARLVRLTSAFYRVTWGPCSQFARAIRSNKRRETFLSLYGPLSLILLIGVWGIGLTFGFALLQWAARTPLNAPEAAQHGITFGTYLYASGVTFLTLGFGDVTPLSSLGRTLAVTEAGIGFGFLAIVIGYLPVIYQAFSRREAAISLLDARAGSPPTAGELLRRHGQSGNIEAIGELLRDWERWSAELLESHLSYPVLCFFRSQHNNQSWLSSLTTILDTSALVMVGVRGLPGWQAGLTFAMARHAVIDLAQVFYTTPRPPTIDRLPATELQRMRETLTAAGASLRDGSEAEQHLHELRQMYEPYVNVLSEYLLMPLPPWNPAAKAVDNWQTSAWGRSAAVAAPATVSSPMVKSNQDEHAW